MRVVFDTEQTTVCKFIARVTCGIVRRFFVKSDRLLATTSFQLISAVIERLSRYGHSATTPSPPLGAPAALSRTLVGNPHPALAQTARCRVLTGRNWIVIYLSREAKGLGMARLALLVFWGECSRSPTVPALGVALFALARHVCSAFFPNCSCGKVFPASHDLVIYDDCGIKCWGRLPVHLLWPPAGLAGFRESLPTFGLASCGGARHRRLAGYLGRQETGRGLK